MNDYQYSAKEALEMLMAKIRSKDESLAEIVQAAIDAGKDTSEIEPSEDRRKKDRIYRKTVAYTHAEGLRVALEALHSFFVEQPLIVDSTSDEFVRAVVGVPPVRRISRDGSPKEQESLGLELKDEEKRIEIELQTETQISKSGEETQVIQRIPQDLIRGQEENFRQLRKLTNFNAN